MNKEGYNGWKNWETWCVVLWLDNDEANYKRVKEHKQKMLKMDRDTLIKCLYYHFKNGDMKRTDYNKISIREVKRYIKELE